MSSNPRDMFAVLSTSTSPLQSSSLFSTTGMSSFSVTGDETVLILCLFICFPQRNPQRSPEECEERWRVEGKVNRV